MFKQLKIFKRHEERQSPKRKAFYGTKKSKLLEYILPTILIAFFLLIILLNMEFNDKIHQIAQTNALQRDGEENFIGNLSFEMSKAVKLNETIRLKREIIQSAFSTRSDRLNNPLNRFKEFQFNSQNYTQIQECVSISKYCTYSCTYGKYYFSTTELNDLQERCPNTELSLTVNKFGFHEGILEKTFFDGQFSLMYFEVNECQLEAIQNGAFTHKNVRNLQTLKLINNQLLMLQASTMVGLINIKYFEFKQLPLQKEFKGKEFLQPFVNTVTKLIIQPSINSTFVTDPLQWWQNSILDSVLHLDLSNTNFQNILAANTFQSFTALETLLLFNCNIQNFVSKTFNIVANTLKFLDLRFNHLKTLDTYFFYMMGSGNVKLNVELNEWFCECDSGLFEFLESYNADLMEEIICYRPEEYNKLNLMQLDLKCRTSGTTAITIEVSSSTTWETTSSTNNLTPASTISPPYMSSTPSTPKPIYTTTTSLPIITETITLTCYKDIHKAAVFTTHILKETLSFTIYSTSTTSVRIEILFNEQREQFTVFYFSNYNDSQSLIGYTTSSKAVHITLTNLHSSKVYLFCVIKDFSTAMSPYDCQAHYLASIQQNAWLLQQDKAWFLTTSILLALIIFLCSVFVVYCLLRRHPYWLGKRNNEHILQGHNRSSLSTPPHSGRSSIYLKPSVVKADISAESRLYFTKHTVPISEAPGSPPSTSRANAWKTTLPPRNAYLHSCKVNCMGRISEQSYQAIEHHYEEVNF